MLKIVNLSWSYKQDGGMEGQNDKKSKTPSPFEGHDADRGDDKPEGMPSNGLMQNGIEEEPYRY